VGLEDDNVPRLPLNDPLANPCRPGDDLEDSLLFFLRFSKNENVR